MRSGLKALRQTHSIEAIFYILGFIAFYLPASYAIPTAAFFIWKHSISLVGILACLKLFLSQGVNARNLSLFLYYFWIYIIASVGSSSAEYHPWIMLKCIGCVAYMELLFQHKNQRSVLKYFLVAGVIMSCVHFGSFIIYGDRGMLSGVATFKMGKAVFKSHSWYFLKHDNGSVYYFIPIMCMLLYYSIVYNRKIFKYFLAYSSFVVFMFVYKLSATAMVVSAFMFASLLYIYVFKRMKGLIPFSIFNYTFANISGLICEVIPLLIVGGRFASYFASLVGKGASFSGRSGVWANSFMYIAQNPLMGMGIEDDKLTTAKIGINHCHSLIVQNLYMGGIIAMALFVLVIICYRPKRRDKLTTAIFSVGIIAFFVTGSMDWYHYYPLPMSLFVFNYYLNMRRKK